MPVFMNTQNQNMFTKRLPESAQCDFSKPVAMLQHQEEVSVKMAQSMFIESLWAEKRIEKFSIIHSQ